MSEDRLPEPRTGAKDKKPCNAEWSLSGLTVKCMRPEGHDRVPGQAVHQCHGLPGNATVIWAQQFGGAQ